MNKFIILLATIFLSGCLNQKDFLEESKCKVSKKNWYGPIGIPVPSDFVMTEPLFDLTLSKGKERIHLNHFFVMYESTLKNEYVGVNTGKRTFLMTNYINHIEFNASNALFFIPLKDSSYLYFEASLSLNMDSIQMSSFYKCFCQNIEIESGDRLDSLIDRKKPKPLPW